MICMGERGLSHTQPPEIETEGQVLLSALISLHFTGGVLKHLARLHCNGQIIRQRYSLHPGHGHAPNLLDNRLGLGGGLQPFHFWRLGWASTTQRHPQARHCCESVPMEGHSLFISARANIVDPAVAWSTLAVSGPLPHPRAGMTFTRLQQYVYLFGGSGPSAKCFNDLQVRPHATIASIDVNFERPSLWGIRILKVFEPQRMAWIETLSSPEYSSAQGTASYCRIPVLNFT